MKRTRCGHPHVEERGVVNGPLKMAWRRCVTCREYLPLGPATITPEVAVEIRAAEIAISAAREPMYAAFIRSLSTGEHAGWWGAYRATYCDAFGWPVDADEFLAGWLAREIAVSELAKPVGFRQHLPCDECGGDHVNGAERWSIVEVAQPRSIHHGCGKLGQQEARADAAFIAAARTVMPECLDEIARLREALTEALDRWDVIRQRQHDPNEPDDVKRITELRALVTDEGEQ